MGSRKDTLFNYADSGKTPFRFNAAVAGVFDNMINRSVPLYSMVQTQSSLLACQFYKEGTTIFDIGCSTGLSLKYLSREMKRRNQTTSVHYTGLDKSPEMCRKTRNRSRKYRDCIHVDIQTNDLLDCNISGASVILCHYTIQFLNQDEKIAALEKMYLGLLPGGLLILSDKINPDESGNVSLYLDVYDRFKRDNGYSQREILEKRNALNGVLIPITAKREWQLLNDIGFVRVELIIKWFQFATFVAFKPES